jgi:uncharacterized protein YeaO (DUF488 family)
MTRGDADEETHGSPPAASGSPAIRLKRAYDGPSPEDGVRVLVERLWPRGLSKGRAAVDLWLKEVAPSPELRKWFGHDPEKWPEFRRRYREELRDRPAELERLRRLARDGPVTFVYAARDTEHNSASVLRAVLEEQRRATA